MFTQEKVRSKEQYVSRLEDCSESVVLPLLDNGVRGWKQ